MRAISLGMGLLMSGLFTQKLKRNSNEMLMIVGLSVLLCANYAFAADTIREEFLDDPYEDLLYDDRYDYYYDDGYVDHDHHDHDGGSKFTISTFRPMIIFNFPYQSIIEAAARQFMITTQF